MPSGTALGSRRSESTPLHRIQAEHVCSYVACALHKLSHMLNPVITGWHWFATIVVVYQLAEIRVCGTWG
eukprot:IDg11599t1